MILLRTCRLIWLATALTWACSTNPSADQQPAREEGPSAQVQGHAAPEAAAHEAAAQTGPTADPAPSRAAGSEGSDPGAPHPSPVAGRPVDRNAPAAAADAPSAEAPSADAPAAPVPAAARLVDPGSDAPSGSGAVASQASLADAPLPGTTEGRASLAGPRASLGSISTTQPTAGQAPVDPTSTSTRRVAVATVSTHGGPLPNATRVVSGLRSAFLACYEADAAQNPQAAGSIRFTLRVSSAGRVESVDATPTGLPSSLVKCATGRARGAQFEVAEAGSAATVQFSATFGQR